MRLPATLLLAVLSIALVACGGAKPAARPAGGAAADAAASAERLASAVRAADPRAACRALTLASRRVVALTQAAPDGCPGALDGFLSDHDLAQSLPAAHAFTARVAGARATVGAPGLGEALRAVRNAGGWRVSLVGLPGVRGDVAAARACAGWVAAADATGLPPFTRGPLTRGLRAQAALVERLRGRLVALPGGGPPRPGLASFARALGIIRTGLRVQARRVAAGADVETAMQATARGDRLVRALLASEGAKARVACPLESGTGADRALGAACRSYGDAIDGLAGSPGSAGEARAALRRVDDALGRLDGRLRRTPVPAGLRRVRAASRVALARMRRAVAELGASGSGAAFAAAGRRVEGRAAQVETGLIRLGATCLGARGPRGAPRPRRLPSPSPLPSGSPPGTVES